MYSETTGSIRISVEPQYVPEQSAPDEGRYAFAYRVTIENHGHDAVQLLRRHWRITDGHGRLVEVEGEGVVGEQPVIEPGQSFRYVSGVPLETPTGIMTGTYRMRAADGRLLDVRIPAFSLDAPGARGAVN